ncbi:MAG: tetratricopeptide repeat protein [Gammaproteobacteria bacterium]|nr:tetratricopeptide repeat protein [Gammaproteobacteria bacterium]
MLDHIARNGKGLFFILAVAAGLGGVLWYGITLELGGLDPQMPEIDAPADQLTMRASELETTTPSADRTPNPEREISTTESTAEEQFRNALMSGEFEAAVAQYDRIYTGHGIERSETFRQILINHASSLIQDHDTTSAIKLLQTYLATFYDDMDVLFTLGRAYRNDGQLLRAFEAFQAAHRNADGSTLRRIISVQQYDVIARYVQQLKEQNKLEEIIQLYRRLSESQPYVPGYYIALARAYAAMQRYDEAVKTLRIVQTDAEVGNEATQMIREYLQNL